MYSRWYSSYTHNWQAWNFVFVYFQNKIWLCELCWTLTLNCLCDCQYSSTWCNIFGEALFVKNAAKLKRISAWQFVSYFTQWAAWTPVHVLVFLIIILNRPGWSIVRSNSSSMHPLCDEISDLYFKSWLNHSAVSSFLSAEPHSITSHPEQYVLYRPWFNRVWIQNNCKYSLIIRSIKMQVLMKKTGTRPQISILLTSFQPAISRVERLNAKQLYKKSLAYLCDQMFQWLGLLVDWIIRKVQIWYWRLLHGLYSKTVN